MLDRREFVQKLLVDRKDLLVVSGLGSPTYDVAACGDHPLNFYLWGAMGGAAMIGLGLALAQPSLRVLVLTGDGEALMGLGSLATIGVKRPVNLAIVVLDNQHYGETGMQPSHTRAGIDLVAVAKALKRCCAPHAAFSRRSCDQASVHGGIAQIDSNIAVVGATLVVAPLRVRAPGDRINGARSGQS